MTSKYFLRALALCVATTLVSGGAWAQGDCATALTGLTPGMTVVVDNSGTADLFTSSCASDNAPNPNTGNEVWHDLGMLPMGNYRLETTTNGSITDTVMTLLSGACPGVEVDCNDDTTGLFSRIDFAADGSTQFYVVSEVWGGHATQLGTWNLTLTAMAAPMPPVNDTCATATVIDPMALPFTDNTTDTTLATDTGFNNLASIAAGGDGMGPDVWWSFTPTVTGTYTITSANANDVGWNSAIAVVSSPCPGAEIDSQDDFSFSPEPLFPVALTAGTEVFIVIEGRSSGDRGQVIWTLNAPAVVPPNDTCASATVINPAALPFMDTFDLGGASDEGTDNSASVGFGGGGGPDVFYSFTPTNTADYVFTADGADLGVGVFAAPCVGAEIGAVDDTFGGESITITLTAGVEVLFLAEGFDAATNSGTITVTLTELAAPMGAPGFGVDIAADTVVNVGLGNGAVSALGSAAAGGYFAGDFMGSDLDNFFAFEAGGDTIDTINANTGAITTGPAVTGLPASHDLVTIAWNPNDSQFWATSLNTTTFADATIGTLNVSTGAYANTFDFTAADPIPQALAFDNAGNAFVFMVGAASPFPISFASFNTGTGAVTAIGPCGVDDATFFDADFDDLTGTLYYMIGGAAGGLSTVNTATGATTPIGALPGSSISAFAARTSATAGVDNWAAY